MSSGDGGGGNVEPKRVRKGVWKTVTGHSSGDFTEDRSRATDWVEKFDP